ncbi:MAG: hypothetical protein PHW04_03470 [Candidatus Wallbacteria bacterium]|nr:hypothetical protein [Candidatus Wallbacteria bacterium]
MYSNWVKLITLLLVVFWGVCSGWAADSGKTGESSISQVSGTVEIAAGPGMAAVQKASSAGKYLFAFFFSEDTDEVKRLREVFLTAAKTAADRANSVEINIKDSAEISVVKKFGVDRAPMPLVLVLAPNGAVTGGFPTKFNSEQILGSFVSPCMEKCLKALQDQKLVLLSVHNSKTKSNDAAMKGVSDFISDPLYSAATVNIILDPADTREISFMTQLKIEYKGGEAVTVFLGPPGAVIAAFPGATDKDMLVKALTAAMSSCGSGCGSGGCK